MRRRILSTAAMLILSASAAAAQTSIPWYTVDCGAAQTSSGGGLAVRGGIGQPDAGVMTSGGFTIVGGYWQPIASASVPCTGDVDGDGSVGLPDLTQMLSAFGACAGDSNYTTATDINADGCVDISDLGLLLGNFGTACP